PAHGSDSIRRRRRAATEYFAYYGPQRSYEPSLSGKERSFAPSRIRSRSCKTSYRELAKLTCLRWSLLQLLPSCHHHHADILDKFVIVYIDDILVYSMSFEEHVCHVRTVLTRLLQNHLYVKGEKCKFHCIKITFLGYVISQQGVEMDQTKVRAVTEWPEPTTVRELQCFLGFAIFYQRFIRNYSSIAGPLTSLLKGKPRRLVWNETAREAFVWLRTSFTTAPILCHPEPNLPFIVEVDASSSGIGAVLSQQRGTPEKLHPCAFYSRKLTMAKANYDVGNRELLSIKASLEEWRMYRKLVPMKGLTTAMQTAEALFQHMFHNFGLPANIISDRGSQFTSGVWRSFCEQLGIRISLSSGYHPRSNGQAELLNQEIERFLQSYCSREQHRWSEFLPWAEYAQNSLTHSSTGLTPFQCVSGYQPPLFPWSGEPSNILAVAEWSCLSKEVWEWAHIHLQRVIRRQKRQADQRRRPHPSYTVGQSVWLSTHNLKLKLPCRKLTPKFIGPFKIVRQVSATASSFPPHTVSVPPSMSTSLLKPVHPCQRNSPGCEPPLPLDIDGAPAYIVSALLNSRQVRSRLQYLVHWEGYGPEEHSWVNAADILDPALAEDFHRAHPSKPASRARGRPCRRTTGGVPGGRGYVTSPPRSGH
ncbi:hypothetical protein QTP70_022645, partial [Hemibagrus guttatus]